MTEMTDTQFGALLSRLSEIAAPENTSVGRTFAAEKDRAEVGPGTTGGQFNPVNNTSDPYAKLGKVRCFSGLATGGNHNTHTRCDPIAVICCLLSDQGHVSKTPPTGGNLLCASEKLSIFTTEDYRSWNVDSFILNTSAS